MGCWAIGGSAILGGKQIGWGHANQNDSIEAVRCAIEQGINFFDTADIYGLGQSEIILGREIKNKNDIIICSKAGNLESSEGHAIKDFSPSYLQKSLESSLRRLQRDYLDVFLLHGPPRGFFYTDELKRFMEDLVSDGKILLYGISGTTIDCCVQAIGQNFGTVFEGIYNILDRRAEKELLPLVAKKGHSFISRVPLASGYLSRKMIEDRPVFSELDIRSSISTAEHEWRLEAGQRCSFLEELSGGIAVSSLRFCLSNLAVSVVIPGMRNKFQVLDNVVASKLGSLDDEIIGKIISAVPSVYEGWRV
jgi:aryl-alcohol dehydrogenase-like predicted oxidoreductase